MAVRDFLLHTDILQVNGARLNKTGGFFRRAVRDFFSQKVRVPTELLKVEHAKVKPASMSVSSTFLGMQERACNFYHFLTVPGDEWVASHHKMLPCIISPIPLQGTYMTMACSIGCNLCRALPWTQQMTQLQLLLLFPGVHHSSRVFCLLN